MIVLRRDGRFSLRKTVPAALRQAYGGLAVVEKKLETANRNVANERAAIIRAMLKSEFAARLRGETSIAEPLREIYEAALLADGLAQLSRHAGAVDPAQARPVDGGAALFDQPLAAQCSTSAKSAGQGRRSSQKDRSDRHGRTAQSCRSDPDFADVAESFMRQWKAKAGRKATNTENQKRATYRLFQGFWANEPIRAIGSTDAARFYDTIRLFDPHWVRPKSSQSMSWDALLVVHGNRERGLSDATMNRHMATLKALWDWAQKRGHCEGSNPFVDFHTRLRAGVNMSPYRAWEHDELNNLLVPPPRRSDLLEITLVGMHSGLRLDEIASLTWGQMRQAEGVTYFEIRDAKTPAGNRQVPVHPALSWLTDRACRDPEARIWPTFNPEGPGKKAGADAGREFSRFKASRGFRARSKAFHSFRKNVTRIMERAGVAENEWAQVLGHERGFTYRVYNPDGITLTRKAEIVALISYPGVELPTINRDRSAISI
ncbi:DUF6538 domain-containing protein [Glacieibacterium frigidum]|uniref:Core-binding (CB) domain-containing protein n=1 Tax=Glacieibacterium frigidum TaxID=2593303 RepID=A0A552UAB3_9SPHN|nr:DUF6538 domain-containing protein [Glacieibacterium frigidum]TRW15129.1 hypothetical protein FMM06_15905 [Glacieibacterium frigidum]